MHGDVCIRLGHLLRIASVYHQHLVGGSVKLPLICGVKRACAGCQEGKVVEVVVAVRLASQGRSSQHACRIYKLSATRAVHVGHCAEALVLAK